MAALTFEGVVCSDCLSIVANGDWTGLDIYTDDYRRELTARIEDRLKAFADQGVHLAMGDGCDEFSHEECCVCSARLGGHRHEVVGLSSDIAISAPERQVLVHINYSGDVPVDELPGLVSRMLGHHPRFAITSVEEI